MERIRALGMAAGATRSAAGLMLLVSPRLARRTWHGPGRPDEHDVGSGLVRALGARDLTIGAGTWIAATLGDDESPTHTAQLLRIGFVSDITDALTAFVSLIRPRRIARTSTREVLAPAVLAAIGFGGLAATEWTERTDAHRPEPTLPGEIRVTIPEPELDLRPGVRTRR